MLIATLLSVKAPLISKAFDTVRLFHPKLTFAGSINSIYHTGGTSCLA